MTEPHALTDSVSKISRVVILTAFGLVLLVACANVTNMMLARGFSRQREIAVGIRMALGASVRQIVSGMMNETLRIALVGLGAGLTTAFMLTRALRAAIETSPAFGPGSYVVGASIVRAATAVAALLPSLRAARIDPSKALRAE